VIVQYVLRTISSVLKPGNASHRPGSAI